MRATQGSPLHFFLLSQDYLLLEPQNSPLEIF